MFNKYLKFFVGGAILLGILVYLPLWNGYFIQDEWQLFSIFDSYNNQGVFQTFLSFIIPQPGQYVPIAQILAYGTFLFFKLNYLGYFLIGIALHFIVATLLAYLVYRLTLKKGFGVLAGLLFLISPSHFQATSWIIANFGYSGAMILFLLGLIFYFKWLDSNNFKDAIRAALFLFGSLLAKEITIFIFIALPILTYVWTQNRKKTLQTFWIIIPVFLFAIWHFLFLKFNPTPDLSVHPLNLGNLLSLPFRAVAQSLIPDQWIYHIAVYLGRQHFLLNHIAALRTNFDTVTQSTGALIIVLIINLIMFIGGVFIYRKNRLLFKMYLSGIILTALSSFPYIYVDTARFSLLQPRYVYMGVACMSLSVIALLETLLKVNRKATFLLGFIIIMSFSLATYNNSRGLANEGIIRKSLLKAISNSIPQNSNQTIIYIESDSPYYGLVESVHILPFQNGLGKTLAIYLADKVYIPPVVYVSNTLWPIQSQGVFYNQYGAFGYFRDYNTLKEAVLIQKLSPENIYAFSWHDTTQALQNISQQVRESLK